MKVTKFVHACVLVEHEGELTLFDPGEFSWNSGLFPTDTIEKLDRIIITHEHFDHFYPPFVEALVARFPDVRIIAAPEVVAALKQKHITAQSISDEKTDVAIVKHASMEPFAPAPCDNLHVHYAGVVTHPGDTHSLTSTQPVLLLPLAGPWGATIDALRMAIALQPKVVIPIHDWMWNDTWQDSMYDRMEAFFKEQGIEFMKVIDGEPVEVNL